MAHVHDGHYAGCAKDASCRCKVRRYGYALLIALTFAAIEIVAGQLAHSGALIADAIHLLTDNVALMIAIGVGYAEAYNVKATLLRRIGRMAIIALLMMFVVYVFIDGLSRLWFRQEFVLGIPVMIVAFFGAIANYVQHKILEGAAHEHKDALHQGNVAHILGDLWISIGVLCAGAIIYFTDWVWVDPVISMAIGVWISVMIARLIQQGDDPHMGHAH